MIVDAEQKSTGLLKGFCASVFPFIKAVWQCQIWMFDLFILFLEAKKLKAKHNCSEGSKANRNHSGIWMEFLHGRRKICYTLFENKTKTSEKQKKHQSATSRLTKL